MKATYIIGLIAGVCFMTAACKKNTFHITERTPVENMVRLKVGIFTPSVNNPGVQIKVNGQRVSSIVAYPTPFPGGGLNTGGSNNSDYLNVAPGETNVDVSAPKVGTDVDSVNVLNFSQSLAANKRYTLYVTDTVPNAVGVMVDDDTEAPDSLARIKCLHLMPNVAAVDFYQGTVLIAANVAYKQVTEYRNVPNGTYIYYIREAGTGPTGAILASRSIATSNQRIYTFFSRGYKGTTGVRAPNVSALIVQ
ncbi:DUF4397 domain-containing protein [Chitinophaga barathri]|uniref:DUF4397 domain-containing protein n=1 Tax=Chitinophaga barathri TaxID=1647451 RepID=A0A3N4MA18_9BACT|nr:DUF4397 domain-containing protein [Chitinophaga barathri]RPD38197.1 DUF4397 domain-containing protein [Chitinophaga barathri]